MSPAETVLLDGFHRYVVDDVEPPFSGPRNLITVGLVEAVGAASDGGCVLDFARFMASRTD